MASEDGKISIVIAGGGIAGLALAVGLHKNHPHINFHLYEAIQEFKDVGAGLALHLNAITAMMLIHPDIRQMYFDRACLIGEEGQEMSTELILAHGPNTGELVAELGRATGRKTIARADLLDGMLSMIPKECITLGKRLQKIEETSEGVTAVFEDGTEATADCLIGSDGIHSVTRRYVLGPHHPAAEPKNHDEWHTYRVMVPMDIARERINPRWTSVVPILLGPRGHINCMPLNKGTRLSAGVAVKGTKFDENHNGPEFDPSLYRDYSEDAQKIVQMVADYPRVNWSVWDHDHAPVYFRGRVAMMGDSAHASLPFSGNGAAQALEDAAVFNHLFAYVRSPADLCAVFGAYDQVRRPRSQAVVDIARKFGRVYAYAEGDMHEKPEEMRTFFKEASAFTNNADLNEQNERARQIYEDLLNPTTNGVKEPPTP